MSDSGFGSNSKGATVYSGPRSVGTTGTLYGGPTPPPPPAGTVYNGPAVGGTVYGGPSNAGTVYNGAPAGMPSARQPLGNSNAVNVGARKGAVIFYVIGGFTALRTVLLFFGFQQLTLGANRAVADSVQSVLFVNLVAIAIFALLGVLTQNGNKIALVIGMVLYGLDTVLLFLNPGPNVVFIAVHAYFLYRLFKAHSEFAD